MVRNYTKICSIRNGLGRKSGVSQEEGKKKKKGNWSKIRMHHTITKMMMTGSFKKGTPGSLVCCEYIAGVIDQT